MAPKRQKTGEKPRTILDFYKKKDQNVSGSSGNLPGNKSEPQNAAGSSSNTPGKMSKSQKNHDVKKEVEDVVSSGEHSHSFKVKFLNQQDQYTVECKQPRTVLKVIKSHFGEIFDKNIEVSDEYIIIKLGEQDNSPIVATHFPCCCVEDGKCLVIYTSQKVVQAPNKESPQIFPLERYSIFYIDKEGGRHTRSKSKEIFRCTDLRGVQFGGYCVYGKKEMTVKDAVSQDGRFNDNLSSFTLSDNKKTKTFTLCTETISGLDQGEFKICLSSETKMKAKNPKQQMSHEQKTQQETACSSNTTEVESETQSVLKVAEQKNISPKMAMEETGSSVNHKEIYERLLQQFPALKRLMESRFPGDSYQKQLELRKENFGKIQQAFSEVHRIKKLLEMGKSVCKVIVGNVCQGTGFVLFDNFILTNAHLIEDCIEGNKLKEHIKVNALFNYEEPEPDTNYYRFIVKSLIDLDVKLDYAVLELEHNKQTPNEQVPPGLLVKFGPKPENGEACIIGHPEGGVKKIDPTCIIEPEKREQAVMDQLAPYEGTEIIVWIINQMKHQGIDDISMGGDKEDVSTYNTYMFYGASGSPVFDAHGQLFGLHTAGYGYGEPKMVICVIEYAQPLLTIFEKFVCNLRESGNTKMLDRVKEVVTDNEKLKDILQVEPMEEG